MRKFIPLPLGQFFMGLFWLGIALLVFWEYRFHVCRGSGGMGPATFPKILAVSLTLLVVVYWFQSRKAKAIPFFETAKIAGCAQGRISGGPCLRGCVFLGEFGRPDHFVGAEPRRAQMDRRIRLDKGSCRRPDPVRWNLVCFHHVARGLVAVGPVAVVLLMAILD